jgi:hypothetical protein
MRGGLVSHWRNRQAADSPATATNDDDVFHAIAFPSMIGIRQYCV